MKVARLLFFFATVVTAAPCFSFSLRIHWQFTHVVEGYDWDNRLEISLDGNPVATSDIYKQSAKGEVRIDVPPGTHTLELVDFTWYKGEWEKNAVANDYALDASAIEELDLKADADLDVIFNIAKAKTTVKLTKPGKRAEPLGSIPFSVNWTYENTAADHDYENRMVVYIDGKREFESPPFRESREGMLAFSLPFGKHDIHFQTEVLYEGKWEEQIRLYDYAFDGFYKLSRFSSDVPTSLHLVFDVKAATVVSDLR